MFKKMICLAIALLFILSIAGCGTQNNNNTDTKTPDVKASADNDSSKDANAPEKKIKIGFNNYIDSNEFAFKVHENIKANCDKNGIDLVYAEANGDAQKMITNVQSMLDQNISILFEFNFLPEVGKQVVQMCKEKGVPVIAMDAKYEGAYYFGANNLKAAKVNGEFLAQQVEKKWNGQIDMIVMAYLMSGGQETINRLVGILPGFREKYPDFPDSKVVEFDNGGDTMKTKSIITDYLTAHPDQHHIVIACNSDLGGVGALAAIETANRQNDCFIITYGADTPFQENIRSGKGDIWLGSVAFTPEKYGDYLIPMAKDILAGKEVAQEVNPDHFVVTKDNLDQVYPLKK